MSSSNLPELRPFIRPWWDWELSLASSSCSQYAHMVMERTREMGILKALGFSRFDIVRMLLGEMLCLLCWHALGIALTFLTQQF